MARSRILLSVAAVAALVLATGAASSLTLSGRFLLVYTAGGQQRLAQSPDGIRWARVPEFSIQPGDRPSAVRRGQRLYIFDGVRVSSEGITGAVRRFRVAGSRLTELPPATFLIQLSSPGEAERSSAVSGSFTLDAEGRLMALYALRLEPETNACPIPGQACLKIRTATEAAGSDGTAFAGDFGNRAVIGFTPDKDATEPSAFPVPKGYVIVLSGPGPCLHVLLAGDLHGSYRAAPGLPGGCIGDETSFGTPSGAYRPFLHEYWLYGVSGGRVVRAVTRRTGRQLPSRLYRPLRLPGAPAIASARFALNSSPP